MIETPDDDKPLTPREIYNFLRCLQRYADILNELMEEWPAMHSVMTLSEARDWFINTIPGYPSTTGNRKIDHLRRHLNGKMQKRADVLNELMKEWGDMHRETTLIEARDWFIEKIKQFEKDSGQRITTN